MKKAFSLLETLFALLILGLALSSFYVFYAQILKNSQDLSKILFAEEKKLVLNPQISKTIVLKSAVLNSFKLKEISLKDSSFNLKRLKPYQTDYQAYFKDEKSF